MTYEDFKTKLTPEQRTMVRVLWTETDVGGFKAFLDRCHAPTLLTPYVGVPNVRGCVFIGVEPDGYTHS